MLWPAILAQWLHVFFGIFWFGGTLFLFFVMMPALRNADPNAAFNVGSRMGERASRVMGMAGGLTILFGLINAIAFGPVKSFSFVWTTAYGRTFALAVVLAVIVASLGAQTGRVAMRLATVSDAGRGALLGQIAKLSATSLIGLGIILVCMVAMRFGI